MGGGGLLYYEILDHGVCMSQIFYYGKEVVVVNFGFNLCYYYHMLWYFTILTFI